MATARGTGKVKWFNDAKGYGFIENAAGGPDLFAHYSQVRGDGRRTLTIGEAVAFDVEREAKGLAAIDIEQLDS
jgi:CspA family cold shock protein